MTRRVLAGISLLHMTVLLSPQAQAEFDELPVVIRARVLRVFDRLAAWPAVSGARRYRDSGRAIIGSAPAIGACCSES